MDPSIRAREYLLDNIGRMTRPGNPSFDPTTQHWVVPIRWRTDSGDVVIGDMELDVDGRIVYAPSREQLLGRSPASKPAQALGEPAIKD
jgi:hypothetical protein